MLELMELRIPWQGRDWSQHSRLVIWWKRFFPVSLTETGIRFGVGAFVQPSDGAQLTGNRVELRVFPREPFTIRVRAGLKVERIRRAQCGWATHLYTFTHGAVVHAHFHWGLRGKERIRLKKKKKSRPFLFSCGRSPWRCKDGPQGGRRKDGCGIQNLWLRSPSF